ncbi:C-type lectin domain family 4 member E [Chanos chanos]|uniref:C-type lectin domain family 4 member E n=1 Tax=Chanos chanos TaxID=29144 RepID=A0A6J2W5I2_CHACN|nr:C-type lectin domain family 4 member E-like [Chanos chanos]
MEDVENYTSLQEFTEDSSQYSHKPILHTAQGVKRGAECLRGRTTVFLLVALLASVCANIALGVLLVNRSSVGVGIQSVKEKSPEEPPSLSLKLLALQERFSRLCRDYTALGDTCSQTVRKCRPCPEGWLYIDEKCYYFSEDKLDWQRSRDSCVSMGGHLTILHTHKQHDDLEKEARAIGGFEYHFWIGLSDSETEGEWKWVDNTPVNKTYWNEWDSQPDNHQSAGLHGEDCAVLDSRAKTWHDVPCDYLYKRICEMDAINID